MKVKDICDIALGVSPIPIVGDLAALRYIERTQEGLDESERGSDKTLRYVGARCAAYSVAGYVALWSGILSDKL